MNVLSLLVAKVRAVIGTATDDGSTALQVGGNAKITGEMDCTSFGTNAPVFGSSAKGLVPSSGGGTTTFLRADGTFAAPTATAAPAGNTGEVQFNNAGTAAGAANVEIDSGDLILVANSSPATPGADKVKLFGKKLASRVLPASVGPSGMDAALQPAFWRQKVAWWNPPGNANTVPGILGLSAMTGVGTATGRNVATTNLMTRMRRLGYVSGTTAGSLAGHYLNGAQWTTGNGAGLGGFFYSCRFAFSDAAAVAGVRALVGMTSAVAAPTNVEPSALTGLIALAQLSTDATQLYLVYGGSAAQTPIALGTDFPPYVGTVGTTTGVAYDFTLFAPPGANGVVHYRVERIGTAFVAEGTITPAVVGTQTPNSTTLLSPRAWRCNNATALAVGIDLVNLYIETDY